MTPAHQLTFALQLRPAGELLASLARLLSSPVGWIAVGCLVAMVVVAWRLAYVALSRSLLRGAGESFPGELAMLRAVMASVPDLIYVKDEQSRFLMANQGTADVMGASSGKELRGKTDFDYFPTEMAAGFYQDEQKVIQTNVPLLSQDEHIRESDGRVRWLLTTKVPFRDAEGKTVGIIGIGRDVSALKETEAELKRARENLHFKATHDSLTSLLNREAILDMLGREIARSTRENGTTAVLLADLDHFKSINDRFGHPIGDEVLRETARRFLRAVRTYDLVGRLGGEEFLVILEVARRRRRWRGRISCGAASRLRRFRRHADRSRSRSALAYFRRGSGAILRGRMCCARWTWRCMRRRRRAGIDAASRCRRKTNL